MMRPGRVFLRCAQHRLRLKNAWLESASTCQAVRTSLCAKMSRPSNGSWLSEHLAVSAEVWQCYKRCLVWKALRVSTDGRHSVELLLCMKARETVV